MIQLVAGQRESLNKKESTPSDLFAKRSVSLDKFCMEIDAAVASLCHSRKAVEVQLPTKGIVLGLVKVQRHDLSEKLVDLVHFE